MFEVINEIGFAMLLPVGFALSHAALRQIGGLMISVFYLNFFLANVGRIDGWLESMGGTNFWLLRAGVVGAAALVLAIEAWTGRQLVAPTER